MSALWVFLGLFGYNVLVTVLVQAEARNRPWLSACLAGLTGTLSIGVTTLAVLSLQHAASAQVVLVYTGVAAGNFAGTFLGTQIGKRWVRAAPLRRPPGR
ncbi:MAG: hypothetical protein KGL39_38180 [Patescibacteria group bacterium]|nr:hypothetical protein [Patescibacteria group bacterium]